MFATGKRICPITGAMIGVLNAAGAFVRVLEAAVNVVVRALEAVTDAVIPVLAVVVDDPEAERQIAIEAGSLHTNLKFMK